MKHKSASKHPHLFLQSKMLSFFRTIVTAALLFSTFASEQVDEPNISPAYIYNIDYNTRSLNSNLVESIMGLIKVGAQQLSQIIEEGTRESSEDKAHFIDNVDVGDETSPKTISVGDASSYKTAYARNDWVMIKMFWKKGYKWNGSRQEKKFCLECRGSCGKNDILVVNKCDKNNKYQRWVLKNNKIRPYRKAYQEGSKQPICLHSDESYPVTFKECMSSRDANQEWELNLFGSKFEFQQTFKSNTKRKKFCLSTRDHPNRLKKVRLIKCDLTVKYNTNFWVIGMFHD